MSKHLIVLIAAMGSCLVAGVFLAFSNFIMTALGRIAPASGIAAMQSINIVVINPLFMAVLFGSGLISLYLGYDAVRHWSETASALVVVAAACYVFGTIGVTMVFNVPLNNQLAGVVADAGDGLEVWNHYVDRWTFWNHVRCLAALLAGGLYIWSLRTAAG